MSWGAMMGLGQGLQQTGQMIMDYNKDKLRERLEIEREQRKEERDRAKEQRQLRQFDPSQTERYVDEQGQAWEIRYSKGGEQLEQRPLSGSIADNVRRQHELGGLELDSTRASLEGTLLGNRQTELELSTWDEDRQMEREAHNARISQMQASAEASRARALRTSASGSGRDEGGQGPTTTERANFLIDEFDDLISTYTSGDSAILTLEEVNLLAENSVKQAADRGLDAGEVFRNALGMHAAKKRKEAQEQRGSTGSRV